MIRDFPSRLKAKLGDLWWYTILLFVAQRLGDVINLFVGLWIVPRYVPMEDLGAVLPITAFTAFIALPLAIVTTPFQKFVALFNSQGELGKVKSLIRDVFIGTLLLGLVTFLVSWLVLPFFFERMRLAAGSLGALMLALAIAGAVSGVFCNAVTGLKRFDANVWLTLLGAPMRLVVMLVTMPFRALSGYVLGQGAPHAVSILGSLWALRDFLKKGIKCEPYLKEYGREIFLYTLPIVIWTAANAVSGSVDTLVIRHRLSDFESAGYYMISRFSEIAGYLGLLFPSLLFPMVASMRSDDPDSRRLLLHSTLGTFVCGLLVAAIVFFFGGDLLGLTETWRTYRPLAPHMTLMALTTAITVTGTCFITFETAQGRFRFLWYVVPLLAMKSVFLYAITGYGFFMGKLPAAWFAAIAEFNPCRLEFVLETLFVTQVAILAALLVGSKMMKAK